MKHYKITELAELIEDCRNYAYDEDNYNEGYIDELNYINEQSELQDKWHALVNSGVFYDAIGKVVEVTDNEVSVIEEY